MLYREEGRVPSFQVIQEYIKLVWFDSLPYFCSAALCHLLLLMFFHSLGFFLCLSNSRGKKQCEVSDMFTISLENWIELEAHHTTKSRGLYFRLRNTKSTNHSARSTWEILNNYSSSPNGLSSSPNGLWVNSLWGRRPNAEWAILVKSN